MTLPAHAITPCDTRQPPRPAADHPANQASREKSMRVVDLAMQIAVDGARRHIENMCPQVFNGGPGTPSWYDTSTVLDRANHAFMRKVLRYIELREPDAFPFRFVRHPDPSRTHLVRFEAKP